MNSKLVVYSCPECELYFSSLDSLSTHYCLDHISTESLKCPICKEELSTPDMLVLHFFKKMMVDIEVGHTLFLHANIQFFAQTIKYLCESILSDKLMKVMVSTK